MSSTYQTLYRKYRSQTFADLVGQEAISRALQGAVVSDRVAHAYLFSGTRGTGKTSMARLLARAVNCTGREAGSAEPCNACASCSAVLAGAALDLIEIDAASNRGIDEIRDLREKVNLAPALGRRKVYIIDEAHMLTPEAFNALLKTLEEPPEHVMFVLCTTESQKVPLTVLGRCQQFVFRRFTEDQIAGRLAHIAELEGISAEPEALDLVARTAQGSMRDAVGLMDQLVPLAASGITLAGARELLGIADPQRVERLVDLVLEGRAREAVDLLGELYEGGAELRQLVRGILESTRDRLVAAVDAGDRVGRARLSAALDALLHLDGEVRRHGEPRLLVEAALVRLAAQDVAAQDVAGRDVAAEVTAASTRARAEREAATQPASASRPPAGVPTHGSGRQGHGAPSPGPGGAGEAASPTSGAPGPRGTGPGGEEGEAGWVAAKDAPDPGAAAGAADLGGAWRRVLDGLPPTVRAYFREARPEISGSVLVLGFRYSFHHKKALENQAAVVPLVAAEVGEMEIELRLQDGPGADAKPERPPAPEEHPVVQAAVRKLEGRVTRVREIRR